MPGAGRGLQHEGFREVKAEQFKRMTREEQENYKDRLTYRRHIGKLREDGVYLFAMEDVREEKVLGKGEFGAVFKGTLMAHERRNEWGQGVGEKKQQEV